MEIPVEFSIGTNRAGRVDMSQPRCRVAKSALDRFRKTKRLALLFVAVAVLSGAPAFGDITGVSVSGSANGSGTLTFYCLPPALPPCSASAPDLNFSGTNSSLGTFSTSGSTSGLNPFDSLFDTVTGEAQQVTTATADSLTIELLESASSSVEGFFIDIYGALNVSIRNGVTVSFDLATASVLQLSFCAGRGPVESFCQLSDLEGNVILTDPTADTTDVQLPAGKYNLFYFNSFDVGSLVGASFSADNTWSAELVPEPSKAAFLPLAILLFALGLRRWSVRRLRMTPAIE